VTVEFQRPARETSAKIVPTSSAHMRFRLSRDAASGWARIKTPGERMSRADLELMPTRQPTAGWPPPQRLLGDAMSGRDDSFTRQDIIDAQWRIVVGDVLDDAAPLYSYERGVRGPDEAAQLGGTARPWRNRGLTCLFMGEGDVISKRDFVQP
jgi:glucose-6-phosphate 1-dehydrogenase